MIIVITGPTGSGKSALALKVASFLSGQIINADAFQVYKGMDIGTNKTPLNQRQGIVHHLLDIRNPDELYSVADYQKDLRIKIDELQGKNIPIIICGGTGLYIKGGLFDFVFENKVKEPIDLKLEKSSSEELHAYLTLIDPTTAENIHPNNRRRVLRAIEIFSETGHLKSDLIAQQDHKVIYPSIFVALDRPRNDLYPLLDQRVEVMFNNGLVKEVEQLLIKYGPDCRAFQAIGYKQVVPYINGEISLKDSIEATKLATRHYVKRQMSYFRHQLPIKWFLEETGAFDFIIQTVKTIV
jgi:tRNA dimethylallyltransferase